MSTIAIRCGWIFPISSPPVENAWLVATDGVIEYIGRDLPSRFHPAPQRELFETAVLPGLINAHCHLEFSDMQAPIEYRGAFMDWIQSVVRHRSSILAEEVVDRRKRAIELGIRESYHAGTRVLLDTVTAPWSPHWFVSPLKLEAMNGPSDKSHWIRALIGPSEFYVLPAPEVIDINELRFEATDKFAKQVHEQVAALSYDASTDCPNATLLRQMAVSPHAPYTASLDLVRTWAHWTHSRGGLLSSHLAESLEETAWLADRTGPVESALAPFRSPSFDARRCTLREYVDAVLSSSRCVVAHGNYLDDESLGKIARRATRVAIAHCPRTYRHFHPDRSSQNYPLAQRLQQKVGHVLGTDSRASNPDLSLWCEMQTLLDYRGVSGEQIVAMGTKEPAELLGLSDMGTLAVGRRSLCTAVPLSAPLTGEDLYQSLLRVGKSALPLECLAC